MHRKPDDEYDDATAEVDVHYHLPRWQPFCSASGKYPERHAGHELLQRHQLIASSRTVHVVLLTV
jgi:hypothetical protein